MTRAPRNWRPQRGLRQDPFSLLSRRIVSASSATADLYLGFSCADLLKAGRIEKHAPTVFRVGRTLIVLRHDSGIGRLPPHDRLVYVIDDDWRAGVSDRLLPTWYRIKLAVIEGRAAGRLERSADMILTSSRRLSALFRKIYPRARVAQIDPTWPLAQSALPLADAPALRLAYLGAATHQQDALWCLEMLETLLNQRPDLHLLWSGNHPLPQSWRGSPAIETVPAMPWTRYRDWMRGHRFDIGLYPLAAGGFNAARSVNKLGEYDQFGAAVVASRRWTSARKAAAEGACLLLPDDAQHWRYELHRLCDEPGAAHRIAAANRRFQSDDRLARQRALWLGLLQELGETALGSDGTDRA